MALDFTGAFGGSNAPRSGNAQNQERPKTQIWLNVGYEVTVQGENGPETRFINLPVGIPVDTTDKLELRGQNADWNKFQSARNDFLEMLQKHGAKMAPGAEEVVKGLVVKIKRVAGPVEVDGDTNEYSMANSISFG